MSDVLWQLDMELGPPHPLVHRDVVYVHPDLSLSHAIAEILWVCLPRLHFLHYLVFFESFYANPVDNFCSGHKQTDFLQFYLSPNLKFNMGIMNFYTSKDIALSRVMSGKNRNIKYKYQIIKNINY